MEPSGVLSLLCFLNTEQCSVSRSGLPVFILPTSLPLWQAVEDQTMWFSFLLVFFFLSSFSTIIFLAMIQYDEAL